MIWRHQLSELVLFVINLGYVVNYPEIVAWMPVCAFKYKYKN